MFRIIQTKMRYVVRSVFVGIGGFVVFACIESLFYYLFSGKYSRFYLLSIFLWIVLGLILLIFLKIISFVVRVFAVGFARQERSKFEASKLFLLFSSLSPLFFYTAIQLGKNLPGKYWSLSNLGIILFIGVLFVLFSIYLFKVWSKQKKRHLLKEYFLILICSGVSSISGIFYLVSELQAEHWKSSISAIFLFCVVLPFFLIFLMTKRNSAKYWLKYVFLFLVLGSLILAELYVIRPTRDRLVFSQEIQNSKDESVAPENPVNIILLVMDTTRAANTSLFGYKRNTTPNLLKFAEDSVDFRKAVSSSPWTLPSHASLFTGLLNTVHGATHGETTDNFALPLHEAFDTLAEILSRHNYQTAAVVANTAFVGPWTGLHQGFQYFWWGSPRDDDLLLPTIASLALSEDSFNQLKNHCGISSVNSASRINEVALDWLNNKRNKPFFLFINYMETHGIEYLPPPYANMFSSTPDIFRKPRDEQTGIPLVTEERQERISSWYDSELASLDNQIGIFFETLKKMGLYEESLIVVTSDHGELLGEHEDFGHVYWLYEELLHVPLLVKYPFSKDKKKINPDYVQLIDVFAELLNQAGIESPPYIQGQTLDEVQHPIIAEVKRFPSYAKSWPAKYDRDQVALHSRKLQGLKLIQSSDGEKELYNIQADPREQTKSNDPERLAIVEEELHAYMNFLSKLGLELNVLKSKKKKIDEATKERLRALGYIR